MTTQTHRGIELTTPLGKDVLLFSHMSGTERLGSPFQFELSLLSENGSLDADKLLGQPVAVTIRPSWSQKPRHFHGIVTEFSQLGYGEHYHEYHLVMRPWFWLLTRAADCRIFQGKTVVEIFEAVVKEHKFQHSYDVKRLRSTYKPLDYCVQYRETDFNFLSRLLEQEGIYYFFEHTDSAHRMVLADDASAHAEIEGYEQVPYYAPDRPDAQRLRDHLTSWTFVKSVQPGTYATTDYDFRNPGPASALLRQASVARSHAHASFEIFDYPAELPRKPDAQGPSGPTDAPLEAADAEKIAKIRIQEMQVGYMTARGHGNAEGLVAGCKFSLKEYPRKDLNVEYLVVGASYSVASNAYETGVAGGEEFRISVEAIDAKTPFHAPRLTPKPVVQGAQTATVVGTSGEEIDTDEFARVKVQFHWDRKGKRDKDSSCWIRVGQIWAGKQWGAICIPRIGQEVIVSFLEGDPDKPLITGSLYNAEQKPPYALPANKTQSGIKSRSSKGGGESNFNEIRFEDKKGSEEVFVQAEKDLTSNVKHDEKATVGNDRTREVKNNEKVTVGNDRTREVKNNETVDIGKQFHLKVGDEIIIETGQSKIVMKKNGDVTITCMNLEMKASQSVKINGQTQVQVKSLDVKVDGQTSVAVTSGVNMKVEGKMTKVEGVMLDLSGSGIAKLKGGLTMIG